MNFPVLESYTWPSEAPNGLKVFTGIIVDLQYLKRENPE